MIVSDLQVTGRSSCGQKLIAITNCLKPLFGMFASILKYYLLAISNFTRQCRIQMQWKILFDLIPQFIYESKSERIIEIGPH